MEISHNDINTNKNHVFKIPLDSSESNSNSKSFEYANSKKIGENLEEESINVIKNENDKILKDTKKIENNLNESSE